MISMYKFEQVRILTAQGHSDSEIARMLGIHRKTVGRYRTANTPPRYSERETQSRADPTIEFSDEIKKMASIQPQPTAWSIFQKLKRNGYQGSLRTVQRRIEKINASRPKERFFRQKYRPGEQSQLDFKEELKIPFEGLGDVTVQVFVGSMPYSGRFFAKAFPVKAFEAFADGIHSFFEEIGGMTEAIRFDNLSPVVKKVLKGSERLYTDAFAKAHKYYDFKLLPCRPRKGSDKGHVERDIKTLVCRLQDEIKLENLQFRCFEHLNEFLCEFCVKDMTAKSKERFEEEQKTLVALPPRSDAILCRVSVIPVPKYGIIKVGGSLYSVPDRAIGEDVRAVLGPYDVKIYSAGISGELLGRHARQKDDGQSILLEHALPSLVRKPQAMVRWQHRDILFPTVTFSKFYAYLQQINSVSAERDFLRSINLIHHVPLADIEAGMDLVLSQKSPRPYDELSELVLGAHRPKSYIGQQPPIVSNLSQYDDLIPKTTIKDSAS